MLTIGESRLQQLYDYWLACRGDRKFPSRGDIDPIDMRFIIGNLILIDVIHEDIPRFRIRVHGTNLAYRAGYDLTGKMLDDLPVDEFRDLARQSFTAVARSGEPFHSRRDRVLDGRINRYETVMLPLSRDGSRVDMLLVGLIYDDERRR